jgi:epoxyqueuosine reductase
MDEARHIELPVLAQRLVAWLEEQPAFVEFCRTPLVGAAAADDSRWARLKTVAHAQHVLPEDLLPGARSVLAWFLPFQEGLVRENRRGEWAAIRWGESYVRVNALLAALAKSAAEILGEHGARAAANPPTQVFDRQKLVAPWSHRHAAWICGLGTFGVHNLLITREGPIGRFGSLVTDAIVAPSPTLDEELCLVRAGGECSRCIKACPVQALRVDGFDRHACWQRCLSNASRLEQVGDAKVCGKCAVVCPAPQRTD